MTFIFDSLDERNVVCGVQMKLMETGEDLMKLYNRKVVMKTSNIWHEAE